MTITLQLKTTLAGALLLCAALPVVAQPTSTGSGQAYPNKPIELVVHTSAGSGGDYSHQ